MKSESFSGMILLLLGVMSISAGCILFPELVLGDFQSGGLYNLRVQSDNPVTNVTLFLPVPVENDTPRIGITPLTEDLFAYPNLTVELTQSVPGLNVSGAYSVTNNTPWYVVIRADTLPGNFSYRINTGWISKRSDIPDDSVETLCPLGNESVFLPKITFIPQVASKIPARVPRWTAYDVHPSSYQIPVYVEYTGSAHMSVESGIDGFNGWSEGGDARGSNQYLDTYWWYGQGEYHGWQAGTGRFEPGNGVYPNFSHPFWRDVISRTSIITATLNSILCDHD